MSASERAMAEAAAQRVAVDRQFTVTAQERKALGVMLHSGGLPSDCLVSDWLALMCHRCLAALARGQVLVRLDQD